MIGANAADWVADGGRVHFWEAAVCDELPHSKRIAAYSGPVSARTAQAR
jgi:hypothetical protein